MPFDRTHDDESCYVDSNFLYEFAPCSTGVLTHENCDILDPFRISRNIIAEIRCADDMELIIL